MNIPMIATATMLVILLQSAPGTKKTDRDYNDLTGAVHVVRTDYEHTLKSGSKKGQVIRERDRVVAYERSGQLIERVSFGFEDCTLSRHVFRSDDADKRTETVLWGNSIVDRTPGSTEALSGSVAFKQFFKFDGAGNRLEVDEYDP